MQPNYQLFYTGVVMELISHFGCTHARVAGVPARCSRCT